MAKSLVIEERYLSVNASRLWSCSHVYVSSAPTLCVLNSLRQEIDVNI